MDAKIQNYQVVDCGANLTKALSVIGRNQVELCLDKAKLSLELTALAAHCYRAA
jgi:hypothetical protein